MAYIVTRDDKGEPLFSEFWSLFHCFVILNFLVNYIHNLLFLQKQKKLYIFSIFKKDVQIGGVKMAA